MADEGVLKLARVRLALDRATRRYGQQGQEVLVGAQSLSLSLASIRRGSTCMDPQQHFKKMVTHRAISGAKFGNDKGMSSSRQPRRTSSMRCESLNMASASNFARRAQQMYLAYPKDCKYEQRNKGRAWGAVAVEGPNQ